ncbi:MAG: hypothetical protein JSW06_08715 [Thermoplasmatales archaeon]|nr:MAG: hypothetical protein JSW06_08715 [Thermoplasmatales archaeon]
MNKTIIIRAMWVFLITISLLFSSSAIAIKLKNSPTEARFDNTDLDPLIDVVVTFELQQIRSLEKRGIRYFIIDKIDKFSDPDFFVKVFINDNEFLSTVWHNTKYISNPEWSATLNVPDEEEFVNIKIQLWDWNPGINRLCDISRDYGGYLDSFDVELVYSIKTGHWWGDDYANYEPASFDPSGYGRLNGCDDNSIYQNERDCELWFDIYQNDFDGDGIPYWTEINVYETDPEIDNSGEDADNDGVPIEWEHKWGHYYSQWWDEHFWKYDPFEPEAHKNLDLDQDGLDNVEEYLTSQWKSDPFRKDIFLEIDQMEIGPNSEGSFVPNLSKELMIVAFSKHNIMLHIDNNGGKIPFDESTTDEELQNLYFNYFLDGSPNNWKRGAFHYCLIIYNSARYPGFVFSTTIDEEHYLLDSLQISTKNHDAGPLKQYPLINAFRRKSLNKDYQRAIIYAGAIMHEIGHTLGIFRGNTPGCDNPDSVFPFKDWSKFHNYRSCMNYHYTYYLIDYSDGSRGKNDYDDWNRIDLTFFQRDVW